MTIRMRPHHVLCALSFEGRGYDDAYVANMAHVALGQLGGTQGRSQTIRITDEADAICAPCPHRRGLGCAKQEAIDRLDRRHGDALDLAPGMILSWGDCVDRVRARLEPEDLKQLCRGCDLQPSGLCEEAVARLIHAPAPQEARRRRSA